MSQSAINEPLKKESEDIREKAISSFCEMRKMAASNGYMSNEEIEAEIKATRVNK